ncbi:hypothetical protein CLU79DRAFT_426299 [Phycomyces nitens]|nr:hypothetical protein CLU79DRAFT_426299 [Phycomyces nitens]
MPWHFFLFLLNVKVIFILAIILKSAEYLACCYDCIFSLLCVCVLGLYEPCSISSITSLSNWSGSQVFWVNEREKCSIFLYDTKGTSIPGLFLIPLTILYLWVCEYTVRRTAAWLSWVLARARVYFRLGFIALPIRAE